MIVLAFDTETTGLISNHTTKDERQPEVIEFYGALVNLATGDVDEEFECLVKPQRPIPNAEVHHIDDALVAGSPPFATVAQPIRRMVETGTAVLAHNLSFDMEMLDIEFERLGQSLRWPKRRICTIEQTVHLTGHRFNLTSLHEYLFGSKLVETHRAKPDVEATIRCAVELMRRGLL